MTGALFADRALADAAVDKLKVFAQPQRLMILSCLLRGERSVSEIGEATEIAQPALSQQLGELRRASLVSTRREAKQVWYALADEGVAQCVRTMEATFGAAAADDAAAAPAPPHPAAPPRAAPGGTAGFARILR